MAATVYTVYSKKPVDTLLSYQNLAISIELDTLYSYHILHSARMSFQKILECAFENVYLSCHNSICEVKY